MADQEMDKVEYTFPDEQEAPKETPVAEAKDDEPQIEVIDDTPAQDRGRTPLKEPPPDVTEDELSKYSANVRKRIEHFTKGYHDERRAKEAAQREKDEAIRVAQQILEENNHLKSSLNKGQSALVVQAKQAIDLEVEAAKKRYKEAHESFDADALLEAQEKLIEARMKSARLEQIAQAGKNIGQRQAQVANTPVASSPDPRAVAWQRENSWFGRNKGMTGFALALHDELVHDEGVKPSSDDYYERINARMREKFPEAFTSEEPGEAPARRAKSNVVASATRSTAPRKVVLTQTQVNIAKRLGVPLEVYAKQVAALGNQNG